MFKYLIKLKDFLRNKFLVPKDTTPSLVQKPAEQQITPPKQEIQNPPVKTTPESPPQQTKKESIPNIIISESDIHPIQDITLGLDFGTSTTKCIINIEKYDNNHDKHFICAFPSSTTDKFTLCYPTAIGIQDECFVFGHNAEILPESQIIRSIKMAIPCINSHWGQYKSPFMIKEKPGYFNIKGTYFLLQRK